MACHGERGKGSGDIPLIAGIPESLFIQKLMDFRHDKVDSTVMGRIAKGYPEADLTLVARYFSRM